MSKLAKTTETGKLLSFVALANTLVSLGAAPAYNAIYQATVKLWPPIAIYVGVVFFVMALLLAVLAHFLLSKKQNTIMSGNGGNELKTVN